MKKELEIKRLNSNIWKYFLVILTNRRNYIPILAIYFLTLPNTTAQQLGLFTGIGWFVGVLLEVPSGYFSDKFGHKKTLILAKISLLLSTLCFVFGNSLIYFILGSSFIAINFAFVSGTGGAFLHNTLTGLKREKDYGELHGKIRAKVSLISAGMILLLPLLTKISLTMPIKIYLIFDIIGILIVLSLYSPKIKYGAEDEEGEKILSQLKRFRGTGFYITSLFIGIMAGVAIGLSPFKEPFAQSLGLPIIFIGAIMGFSRIIWFIVGHNLKFLKRIKMEKLLLYETFFFSLSLIILSQLKNPYIVGIIIATFMGYYFGRSSIIEEYYLQNFLINKRYKATMLSIKELSRKLFQAIAIFVGGFFMVISFNLGYLVSGIFLLVVLLGMYPFLRKSIKDK